MEKYTLNSARPGPRVLVLAGVHGDEYEPMIAALELVRIKAGELLQGSLTIVPVVNQSAYFSGSRYGTDGLDLARICPGRESGTPSEHASFEVSELIKKADYLIDMHTGGLMFDIYPLVGYMLHPDQQILNMQQQLAKASGLPLIWGTDYRPNGRTLSVARDAGVPALYLEFGGGSGYRNTVVGDYVQAVKRILCYLGMLHFQTVIPQSTGAYWLEDHRPDSGYLQTMMPSPIDGIFSAQVDVGDFIDQDHLLGRVTDPLKNQTIDIKAPQDGMVFLLRTLVGVKKGDALGGILPVKILNKKVVNE